MEDEDLRRLFDDYMKCFDRLDGPGAAAHYSARSFVVKDRNVTRFGSSEKQDYFAALMEADATEGDHKWQIAEFSVTRPAVNGAIVTVRWVARRPDDSIIWDFKDTYFLANTTHGWRILGDMVHDSP